MVAYAAQSLTQGQRRAARRRCSRSFDETKKELSTFASVARGHKN
jgi:hypothetical protein